MEDYVTLLSQHAPKETMDRLEAAVRAKGMTVFARVDHAAGAREAGLALRPTEVLVFGSARAGTPLMQAEQTMGLDLPLKVLVWQDAQGKTWLGFEEPARLAARHGVAGVDGVTGAMLAALRAVATAAAS